ncbi:DHHC palmitoyltransferase-domain-containing protein [Scheffersomyces amazonensis]|uniref:DHHC palmitoyltransferase-domain-containing protein n=1 Tax=Scheffersomyces amazonensis TaxID=1078765 RepID=UPI00315CC1B4
MSVFIHIFIYSIVIASLLAFIIIFGDLPTFRNTPIHTLKQSLVTLPTKSTQWYNYINYHYFNNNLHIYLNWLVPIAYFGVITFCTYLFFINTYPGLSSSSSSSPLLWLDIYIYSSILLIYISTLLSIFITPGQINPTTYKLFKNNQLIFFDNKVCSTCMIIKPARSKHCSICNKCYPLFDHHCIWINNCVGYKNYKWFLLYLISNINYLITGAILTYYVISNESNNWNKSYWQVIKNTTEANRITGMFLILCIIFSFITISFTALHIRYIYLGVTTNELDKWSDIEHLVRIGVLYKSSIALRGTQIYVEKAMNHETGKYVYLSLLDESILIDSEENERISNLVPIVSVEKDLINIYDNGFWNNLRERLALHLW